MLYSPPARLRFAVREVHIYDDSLINKVAKTNNFSHMKLSEGAKTPK